MAAINYFLALRTIALRDVLMASGEYHLRSVFRWYSRTFHTPLHEVGDLPQEDVLRAYYEEHYEAMAPEDREDERAFLLESEEARRKRLCKEEAAAVDDAEYERRVMAEVEASKKMEVKKGPEQPLIAKIKEAPEVLKVGTKIPPNISMVFASEDEWDEKLEAPNFDDLDDHNLKLETHPPPVLK